MKALNAAGYTGDTSLAFYDPRIAGPLENTIVITPFAPFESDLPAMKQLIADVKAFKPDTTLALSVEAGYLSADMFIKAMQKIGKNPTPEKLQKYASTMTYKAPRGPVPDDVPEGVEATDRRNGPGQEQWHVVGDRGPVRAVTHAPRSSPSRAIPSRSEFELAQLGQDLGADLTDLVERLLRCGGCPETNCAMVDFGRDTCVQSVDQFLPF